MGALRIGAASEFPGTAVALIFAARGDLVAYRRECQTLVRDAADSANFTKCNDAAWACVFAPDALPDLGQAVGLAESAVAGIRDYSHLNTLGTVLYRAGRWQEAVARLEEGIKLHGRGGNAWDWLFLAMAHHRLGHAREARKWLDQATAWWSQFEAGKVRDRPSGTPLSWNVRLELKLFLREAEALVKGPGEPKK